MRHRGSQIVFLFGAGASYGAGNVLPQPPPLGNQLYDELVAAFPATWGPGSPLGKYADGFRLDFESTMSNEVLRWNPILSVLDWHRDMARLFGRFTLPSGGSDCYSKLLASWKARGRLDDIVVGSLNYDCVFEIAADQLGIKVGYFSERLGSDELLLAKLHGSCNFITDDLSRREAFLTNPGDNLECGLNVVPIANLQEYLEWKFATDAYPILSFYSKEKRTPLAAGALQRVRNAWAESLRQATQAVIVGVRFNAHDRHVVEAFREARTADIRFIGSAQDSVLWSKLNPNIVHTAETFEEAVAALCSL